MYVHTSIVFHGHDKECMCTSAEVQCCSRVISLSSLTRSVTDVHEREHAAHNCKGDVGNMWQVREPGNDLIM